MLGLVCPKYLTLGQVSNSCLKYSILGHATSSISVRLGSGSALVSSSPLEYVLLTIYSLLLESGKRNIQEVGTIASSGSTVVAHWPTLLVIHGLIPGRIL